MKSLTLFRLFVRVCTPSREERTPSKTAEQYGALEELSSRKVLVCNMIVCEILFIYRDFASTILLNSNLRAILFLQCYLFVCIMFKVFVVNGLFFFPVVYIFVLTILRH